MKSRIFLQYTSEREKKLVREALSLTERQMICKGEWKSLDNGATCFAYRKGSVVVKFFIHKLDARRSLRYYLNTPKHRRKYLARVLAFDEYKIVQRYVNVEPKWTKRQIKTARRISKKMKFYDILLPDHDWGAHNLGVYKGRPVLYDFSHEVVPRRRRAG